MTKGRPFSIYCIILFLYAEVRKKNHILLQRGMYLSQKWSTAPFCPPVRRAARSYGLCVLYDTAARVSEICSLCIEDVRFENPPHSRIMGNGMKVRAVPILPATAKNEKTPQPMGMNCTPFVRQYDILSNRWGDLLCQEENQTNDIRRSSRKWL